MAQGLAVAIGSRWPFLCKVLRITFVVFSSPAPQVPAALAGRDGAGGDPAGGSLANSPIT